MPFYGREAHPELNAEKDRRAVEGATGGSERLALAGVHFETRTAARLESVADSRTFCFGVLDGGTGLRIRPVEQRQPFGLATEPTGLDVASILGLYTSEYSRVDLRVYVIFPHTKCRLNGSLAFMAVM
ncbi:hypothetical protein CKAH01_06098 [Colletotrichum kahawae]|uniref:Uncharacterized protein n=1 Tax=Colletotrichum kahawae TaxID=34407 RepID=A0AAE0D4T2_COLKA|nr:hypothetical protein CKAH01_06098 [Colletotrichum kahawae]